MPVNWFSPAWTQNTVEMVILELEAVGRFTDIVNALGSVIKRVELSDKLLEHILFGAASEQSLNRINSYEVCIIIEKLQRSDSPDIDALAELEFAFLPFLREPDTARPKALHYKLANDCSLFCNLIELTYKPRHGERQTHNLSEGMVQRLFLLTHHYCVVPGTDWNGDFREEGFHAWIAEVLDWAQKADRTEITQQIIGNGLSFAKTEEGLPNETIMEELNKPQNNEMRRGYLVGIYNQRGAYWVDPEGKPEQELVDKYRKYARDAEKRGFTRFSETLEAIADRYFEDAERIREEQHGTEA